jgi:penicillin-binding protein 1A
LYAKLYKNISPEVLRDFPNENLYFFSEFITKKNNTFQKQKDNLLLFFFAQNNTQEKKRDLYLLEQIPDINGAAVILRPEDGAVLSLVGGYSIELSSFDRGGQATLSLASLIKPILLARALDLKKIERDTIFEDKEKIWLCQGGDLYQPTNHDKKFEGPMTIEKALIRSRNIPMISLGMDYVGMNEFFSFIYKDLQLIKKNASNTPCPSMFIGSHNTTLLDIAGSYAALITGRKTTPYTIHAIQNCNNEIIWTHPSPFLLKNNNPNPLEGQPIAYRDKRKKVFHRSTLRVVYNILNQGLMTMATLLPLKKLNLPIAVKTGTSSNARHAWCVVYHPDCVILTYVGYDQERYCGYGSQMALPMAATITKELAAHYGLMIKDYDLIEAEK